MMSVPEGGQKEEETENAALGPYSRARHELVRVSFGLPCQHTGVYQQECLKYCLIQCYGKSNSCSRKKTCAFVHMFRQVRQGLKDSKDVTLRLQHWFEAVHTSSNGYYYADPKLDQADKVIKSMTSREPQQPEMPLKIEKSPIVEPIVVSETEASVKGDEGANGSYKSALSGGLHSQRPDVPQKVILDRIKLKREARSYQLGNQLSMKWCTGAGPRIACVADYPLRMQALKLVNLSPT